MNNDNKNSDVRIAVKAKEDLENWRKTSLNIAISGATTNDKYKFINNFCGRDIIDLNDCDEFSIVAPCKPTPYFHLNNQNVVVWDLPECFFTNKSDYLNYLKIDNYDLFLIFHSNNCYQIDLWLAKELLALNKRVFFIKNYSCFVQSADEANLIESIRVEIKGEEIEQEEDEDEQKEDQEEVINESNVYVVSPNKQDRNKLDFNKLNLDILDSLNQDKAETMTLTVEPFSKEIVDKKLEILKSKTFYSALVSSVLGTFTVPGLQIFVDIAFLTTEIWFYMHQFGLRYEVLKELATKNGIIFDKINNCVNKYKYGPMILINDMQTLSTVMQKLLPLFTISSTNEITKLIPLFGHIIHGSLSFAATRYALITVLDEFAKISMEIIDILIENEKVKSTLEEKILEENNIK